MMSLTIEQIVTPYCHGSTFDTPWYTCATHLACTFGLCLACCSKAPSCLCQIAQSSLSGYLSHPVQWTFRTLSSRPFAPCPVDLSLTSLPAVQSTSQFDADVLSCLQARVQWSQSVLPFHNDLSVRQQHMQPPEAREGRNSCKQTNYAKDCSPSPTHAKNASEKVESLIISFSLRPTLNASQTEAALNCKSASKQHQCRLHHCSSSSTDALAIPAQHSPESSQYQYSSSCTSVHCAGATTAQKSDTQ